MPEPQLKPASDKVNPDEVMLKDVLKPSTLVIALIISVMLILLCWYHFVFQPALIESKSLDLKFTKNSPPHKVSSHQDVKPITNVETKLLDDNNERPIAPLALEEKPEVIKRDITTPRTKSIKRNTFRKSVKADTAKIDLEPTAQSQGSTHSQNERVEKKNLVLRTEKAINTVTVNEENMVKNIDEDTTQKITNFAIKWKESILTPATQAICTQVQITMNQCPN